MLKVLTGTMKKHPEHMEKEINVAPGSILFKNVAPNASTLDNVDVKFNDSANFY
ncbi:3117_t:CDS:2 [Ambispora gerdemannii]|uniref:3117_t:CDS:1 n=1 Tax=Ambispora gerdemannii TaxID=144530 RepID=A0A9N8ZG46_9GLOM|nr:3117_t:CDS:2 [Ambispora gerdemannii]